MDVGDKVTFRGHKGEGTWTGEVTKVNRSRTKITVLATLDPLFDDLPRSVRKMVWQVSPGELQVVK